MGKQAKKRAARKGSKAVDKELARSGVFVRLHAIAALFQHPGFRARLNEAMIVEKPADLQAVRDIAFRLARDEYHLDTTDCTLTLDWQPDLGRKLTPSFHPTIEAAQRAEAAVAARREGRAA